ncbi:MAG: double-strand break repair helicase AddA [Phenylobacterium sp.]|uniref:double-strand break repair helicase AddA n=1 Tax=Phenylobacterium sp. TaxID=1871053 RepID=UPI00391BAB8E
MTHADPQRRAADPAVSAFVTANAGSGKTKTLIDRVARLLLSGAAPEAILCVTYTKAAAAEMQRRLFDRLGAWSVRDDQSLRAELAELEGRSSGDYDGSALSEARALFARALETPGGLKIQTIHAFCEKLLRRFPLEAGISPGFRVMDDAATAAVAGAARKAVAQAAMRPDLPALAEAYARMSVALDFASFNAMFAAFEARRGALDAHFRRCGGGAGAAAAAWAACGFLDGPVAPEVVEAEARAGFDRRLWTACAEVLALGGKADQTAAARLRAVAAEPEPPLSAMLGALFTEGGEGAAAAWVGKTSGLKADEGLRMALLSEQDRLEAARERLRSARVAQDTVYALTLASAYLEAYRIEKRASGALDFADLIERSRDLVAERPDAAWVLYKLDGGIDHILVDEAQDTAPEQWEIITALTAEFFAGAGAPRRGKLPRSLFVVGDEKQSIYSFQGAAPERLLVETEAQLARIAAAGAQGVAVPLVASWRSTAQVLRFVDTVFDDPDTRAGVPPPRGEEKVRHLATRHDHPGCVDLWPLFVEPKGDKREAWDAPLDVESEAGANRRLARAIAAEIADLVARGDAVWERDRGWRPARYGDVLILVRRRRALFEEILRALKQAGIPVAGADRLSLSGHIVFDDLMALARFVLFPEDDLNLAALLRSPFCDVDDEGLYALAHRREGGLWTALNRRADERAEWRAAAQLLQAALGWARDRRPFEFFGLALAARDGQDRSMRARLLTRLGAEAEDALDEFQAQVLAAEARGIEDLERLVADFAGLDIVVKRELESGRDEVRVMTTHGAKGLEAPIVFLPETTLEGGARGSPLMETEDGGFLWCASAKADCATSAAAREARKRKEEEEALRLLYVALTRARDRLVICGRIAANRKEDGLKGWWRLIRNAFEHDDVRPHTSPAACGEVTATRFGPDPRRLAPAAAAAAAEQAPLPAWTGAAAVQEAFARYASPSTLGESDRAPSPSPLAAVGGLGRFRRGDLIHRLLQILPDIAPPERREAAQRLLGRERDLSEYQRREMVSAAMGVLEDPRFAEVFGPGSRAEVAIAGTAASLPNGLKISGRIDRLVVLPERVLVADFKTNRPSPDRIEDADPAYLRQMALYRAVLAEVFPTRRIEAALVWTDGPKLMAVPEFLMVESIADLGRNC